MQFSFLPTDQSSLWDKFVASSPQGSIFSTSTYLNALGINYQIAVLVKNDSIKAGIVLTKNELGAYTNPLFVKYLGILLAPVEKNASYVNQLARERKIISIMAANLIEYHSFDYTFHPTFTNWLPFYWKNFRQETRYTYRFSNITDINKIADNMHSRARGALRKADRNRIRFRTGIDIESFYRINRLSFDRQGSSPPFSINKLQSLYDGLAKENKIHLLGVENTAKQLIAVAGIVNDEKYCYLILNGFDHTKQDVGGNTKLIMETLRYCSSLAPGFDFEGSMIEGIESFYQSFGAQQVPYFSIWQNKLQVILKRNIIKTFKKLKYGR